MSMEKEILIYFINVSALIGSTLVFFITRFLGTYVKRLEESKDE